eukprot:XP_001697205.1 predicted protein [Chlamydomonas reinhardtii]
MILKKGKTHLLGSIPGWKPLFRAHVGKKLRDPGLTVQVYCLPDNYEVLDKSLDDIRHVRDPRFRPEEGVGLRVHVSIGGE